MMARRLFDGTIRIDVSPEEARIVLNALSEERSLQATRAAHLSVEARDRRELSDRVRRGRHANRRVAGELEAEAAACSDQERLAADMCRVLRPFVNSHVSASGEPSRSQLPTASQSEEPPRKYGYTQRRLDELAAEGDTHFLDWSPAKKDP